MTDNTSTEKKQSMPGIYLSNSVGNRVFMLGVAAFILFIASIASIVEFRESNPIAAISLGSAWVVGVPVYFFLEHVLIFRKYGDPAQYEQFKRVQDLAAKVWAGSVLVLAAFYAQGFPS